MDKVIDELRNEMATYIDGLLIGFGNSIIDEFLTRLQQELKRCDKNKITGLKVAIDILQKSRDKAKEDYKRWETEEGIDELDDIDKFGEWFIDKLRQY